MHIDNTNLGLALDLLQAGIRNRSRRFWEAGFERIVTMGENLRLGVPLGHFLMAESRPVGIILTIAGTQPRPGGGLRTVVNLSTWYIEPEHRWRAPMMLLSVTRDSSRAYTSLTPTVSVQKIMSALGFVPTNDGIVITAIPAAAVRRSRDVPVVGLDDLPDGALPASTMQLLTRHRDLGCIGLAYRHHGSWKPLLLKRRSLKGVPSLRVIYSEDDDALAAALGPICRHLLRTGRPLLIMDKPLAGSAPGIAFAGHGKAFIKGEQGPDGIDHTSSELVYFDF